MLKFRVDYSGFCDLKTVGSMKYLFLLLFIFLTACTVPVEKKKPVNEIVAFKPPNPRREPVVSIDLDKIKERGKLVALSRYNASSFFIYRGQPMGYEYDLLKLFAEELGVELEMKTPSTWDSLYIMLNKGEGDIIAANLVITLELAKKVSFSEHHSETRQMLVQRLPRGYRRLKRHQIEKRLIRNPIDLIGKTVTIRNRSTFAHRMRNLIDEVGGPINLDLVKTDIESEQLIRLVSEGIIDYTIADENVASLNSSYFSNIDTKTAVSFPQRVAWAVRKNSPQLKDAIDTWMTKLKANNNPTYYVIYNRYFKNKQDYKKRRKSDHFLLETGNISEYDSLFKKYETELFPWTLLAAQAYQESRFETDKKSRFGAVGLMQLLPTTAEQMGIYDLHVPEKSVQAGTRYLKYLYTNHWSHLPDSEAVKFTLASYNAGPGHVFDAQRVAEKLGLDGNRWDNNVEDAILKLSHKKYIYMPEVKYGFCHGEEPRNYVRDILDREDMYLKMIKEAKRRKDEQVKNGDSLFIVEDVFIVESEI